MAPNWEALTLEKYDLMERCQAAGVHAMPVQSTQDEVYHSSKERGFAWGAIRTPDELINDGHLQDRGFWTQVEHPELGRTFTYPGPAGIYNGTPSSISRRASLIGEHNQEVYCQELGLFPQELTVLAESGVV